MSTSAELEHLRRLNGVIEHLFVADITVPAGRRALDADVVESLAESMNKMGMMTPITVRADKEDGAAPIDLVAGADRLAAAKKLGWDRIPCFVIYDRFDAQMWEISENLHRAELTVLQRAEQVTRWVSLWDEKAAQVAPLGLGRGKKGGNREQARQLRMDRREIERSTKIGRLSEQAKKAAMRAGLDDNQSALLKAAGKAKPAEQIEAIETWGKKDGDPSGIWRSHLRELISKIDAHLERAPSPVDRAYGLKRLDGKWQALPPHNADGEIIDDIAVESSASPHSGEGVEPSPSEPGAHGGASAGEGPVITASEADDGPPWDASPNPSISEPPASETGSGEPERPFLAEPEPNPSPDPAPKASVEGAAGPAGAAAPATSWADSHEVKSAPEMPDFLRRTA